MLFGGYVTVGLALHWPCAANFGAKPSKVQRLISPGLLLNNSFCPSPLFFKVPENKLSPFDQIYGYNKSSIGVERSTTKNHLDRSHGPWAHGFPLPFKYSQCRRSTLIYSIIDLICIICITMKSYRQPTTIHVGGTKRYVQAMSTAAKPASRSFVLRL